MIVLTLETTCDETAAAVVTDRLEVLSSVVASQDALHQRFRGVVPEIAARAHVERILPVVDEALRRANVRLEDLSAIAVANTPGLAGSLLVGLVAAKTLCVALRIPLVAVNHLHAHIYACRIASGVDVFPCVGFIVSGGHTSLYTCASPSSFTWLGGTIDDAAGEAFDKVASMLGLPYPGGPAISRAAQTGNPLAYAFPRPFLQDESRLDFSFSGLKTAVRYSLTGMGRCDFASLDLPPSQVADVVGQFSAGRGGLSGRQIAARIAPYRVAAVVRRRRSRGEPRVSRAAVGRHADSGCGALCRTARAVHRQCGHGCDCRRAIEGQRRRVPGP